MAKRALIIDDEQPLLDIISEVLNNLDIECVQAANGKSAIEIASEKKIFDIILVDMNMPELNGKDTYRELRKKHPKSAVIFMSGYDISDNIREMKLNNPNTFLKKPFSIAQLSKTVQKLVH
jgi:two-component system, cell cycle sensor histidine kinase and response regulator CckA